MKPRHKALRIWIISIALAIPIAIGWLYATGVFLGMAGETTWEIGYYGKFNRVRSTIARMPDVQIIDSWQHHDVTLEDFGFTLRSSSEHTAKVDFLEGSPQLSMTTKEAIEAYVRTSLSN